MLIDESRLDESKRKVVGAGSFGTVATIVYKGQQCVIKEMIGVRNLDGFVKEARFLCKVKNYLTSYNFSGTTIPNKMHLILHFSDLDQ